MLSKKVEYALIAVLHMADLRPGTIVTAKDISEQYHIPADLLGKVGEAFGRRPGAGLSGQPERERKPERRRPERPRQRRRQRRRLRPPGRRFHRDCLRLHAKLPLLPPARRHGRPAHPSGSNRPPQVKDVPAASTRRDRPLALPGDDAGARTR